MTQRRWNKLPLGLAAKRNLFLRYQRQAKLRHLTFELSRDDVTRLTDGNCFYCGLPPTQINAVRGYNGSCKYNGIDRRDNSIGYTVENCVSCCKWCNRAKFQMSDEEFVAYIDRVYKHLHGSEK